MKYSVLVPSYDPDGKKVELLVDVLRAIDENTKGLKYELIIIKNGPSYVQSHNMALERATGDFIAVVTDDVIIKDLNWLPRLANVDVGINSWRSYPFILTGEKHPDFSLWGMHRHVLETIGLMDERYKDGFGFEDDDYYMTARQHGFGHFDANIRVEHIQGVTHDLYYDDKKDAMMAHNRKIFEEKWSQQLS